MAYDYQKRFKQKEIDVLSCSTTLKWVWMLVVWKRSLCAICLLCRQIMLSAGRAGRSSQSAAFALTFCNKSSHDFSYFNDPTKMIKERLTRLNIRLRMTVLLFGIFMQPH